jgi:hypothetical protein
MTRKKKAMTKYLATGVGSRATFDSLEEYAEYCREGSPFRLERDPAGMIGPLGNVRAVDTEYGEYDSKGAYLGGRELNDDERAKLKELEG